MKTTAEKSSSTTTKVTQVQGRSFFARTGGGDFFPPVTGRIPSALQAKRDTNKPVSKFYNEIDQGSGYLMAEPIQRHESKDDKLNQSVHTLQKETTAGDDGTSGTGQLDLPSQAMNSTKSKPLNEQHSSKSNRQFAGASEQGSSNISKFRNKEELSITGLQSGPEELASNHFGLPEKSRSFSGPFKGKIRHFRQRPGFIQNDLVRTEFQKKINFESESTPKGQFITETTSPQKTMQPPGERLDTTPDTKEKAIESEKETNVTNVSLSEIKDSIGETIETNISESAVEAISPETPKEDPEFQKVMAHTHRIKKNQKDHKNPDVKLTEVTDSAQLPEGDQNAYNDRKVHLESINKIAGNNKEAEKKFTAGQFKEILKSQLDDLEKKLPHSEAAAKRFKKEKPLEEIKNKVKKQVSDENEKVASPISSETKKTEPPQSGIVPKTPKPLVVEKPGTKPGAINSVAAAPKPKTDQQISMEKESLSLDELMAKNNNTEEQFAESNEPKFQKALNTKKEAQAKAAAAPQEYRDKEQVILSSAQRDARQHANAGFTGMYGKREAAYTEVSSKQTQHDKDDKFQQNFIKKELERIYNKTKSGVEGIFTELSKYVETTFEKDSNDAKSVFEKRVEDQLDDIHGLGIQDFFFGEDTEAIESVFEAEKLTFLNSMDKSLDTIAQRIAADLNLAIKKIQEGRAEAEGFYKGLNTEQKRLAEDSMDAFRVQFANLESGVEEKQTELAHKLAESYKQNVDSLRKTFEKINEDVSKTWIQRAAEFVIEVATTIYNLGKLLVTVLVRIANVIGDILAHPIRFLENLAAGIKQGFNTFAENFDTYLIEGFFEWLKGKVGGVGIKMPPKLDTAGLFSLALQVIGLTYDNFRRIAKEKLGDPIVDAIERGVEDAQEVYKLLQMARQDIGAFWIHLKELLANAVDELFEKIKKTILYETIKKVLTYIVTLFNPIGAFIKAAQAIYAGIRFLMDNIERIIALVNAFLDSVEMAVQGNVSGIASKVIFGLKNAIIMGIDFLAKLLNLGNLAEKVRTIIKQIKTPVERAMGFVVDKVLKPVVGLITKAGKAVKTKAVEIKDKLFDWWKARKKFKGDDGEMHELSFRGTTANADLIVSSSPRPVASFLVEVNKKIQAMPSDEKAEKIAAEKNWKKAKALDEEIQKLQIALAKANSDQKASGKPVQANQALYSELQGKLEVLAGLLGPMMKVSGPKLLAPPPILPPFSNNVRGQSLEAQYLSADNNVPEGEDSGKHSGNLGAWEELIDEGTRKRDNFVRMHLLHHKLGGKAADSNLTPAKSVINSDYYQKLERPALEETGLLTGRKNSDQNKVIWYSVDIDYHTGGELEVNFIKSIVAKYGYYDSTKHWKKSPAKDKWSATPGVPDHAVKKFVINEDGRTTLRKMKFQKKPFKEDFAELVVLERNESLGNGKKILYTGRDNLQTRLNKRIKTEGWNGNLTNEVDRLYTALAKNAKSDIFLNGSDQ